MILIAVLFFIALLVSGVATFLRRATLDGMIARNRDLASRCEALARGGVQIATALVLQDRLDEESFRVDTLGDPWARIGEVEIPVADGGRLRLRIEDAGARLNLNALLNENDQTSDPQLAENFLGAFFDKVIGEMEVTAEEKDYDPEELARNLIDYIDTDDVQPRGSREDDYYQLQDPPYRAANRPLLSIDELGLVEGFDKPLVEAIRPYATVYPYAGGRGVNPNTAPSYVLAALYHGSSGDMALADEEDVRQILDQREEEESFFCAESANQPGCLLLRDFGITGIYPRETYTADVFQVSSEASYGEVRRTVEAVIDRSDPTDPLILSWRVR
jgi:general secretion pathway protein K